MHASLRWKQCAGAFSVKRMRKCIPRVSVSVLSDAVHYYVAVHALLSVHAEKMCIVLMT